MPVFAYPKAADGHVGTGILDGPRQPQADVPLTLWKLVGV